MGRRYAIFRTLVTALSIATVAYLTLSTWLAKYSNFARVRAHHNNETYMSVIGINSSVVHVHQHLGPTHRMAAHDSKPFLLVSVNQPYQILQQPNLDHVNTSSVNLVIFVQSRRQSTKRRNLIRKTWANASYFSDMDGARVKPFVMFSCGTSRNRDTPSDNYLRTEISTFGDILVLDYVDSYDNLTLKGLLTMSWIHSSFKNARYVFKTDDDVILNMFAWIKIIDVLQNHELSCVLVGFVWRQSKPQRTGRYKVTKGQYAPGYYPPYCSGPGYLMSRDAMAAILETSTRMPMMRMEDVFFTGLIAEAANISHYSVTASGYARIGNGNRPKASKVTSQTLLIHMVKEVEWFYVWRQFIKLKAAREGNEVVLLERVPPRERTGHAEERYYPIDTEAALCASTKPNHPIKNIIITI